MKTKMMNPDELIPFGNNPRNISDAAIEATKKSIINTGKKLMQPIVVDENLVIIVGHTRTRAAIQLGIKVPVLIASDLTEGQIRSYRIADNKTGELSEWSYEALKIEFEQLQEIDFDLSETGFDEPLITSLLEPDAPETSKSSAKVSDDTESPFSKKSFSFHDEQITIINDAVELARTSPIVDTGVNDSASANALTLICREWLEMKENERKT